tara:strand:+ start:821 stop:1162 length:342 start_codon:yes stop_codon:yes gene_type:complete
MKLVELLAIPVGFALVRSITKNIKDEPAPKKIVPTGFTLGPAAGSMDIKPLIPEGAFKITPTQLAAFTPERKVTIPKYDPGVPVAQPIAKGKVIPLGFKEGETTDDLLRRLFR